MWFDVSLRTDDEWCCSLLTLRLDVVEAVVVVIFVWCTSVVLSILMLLDCD